MLRRAFFVLLLLLVSTSLRRRAQHAAKIRIPQQSAGSEEQNALCERLIFTPWHSLEEHRPLGGINRARLTVYQSLSRMRNMMNGASPAEPPSS